MSKEEKRGASLIEQIRLHWKERLDMTDSKESILEKSHMPLTPIERYIAGFDDYEEIKVENPRVNFHERLEDEQ